MVKNIFKKFLKQVLLEILEEESKIDKELAEYLKRDFKSFSKTDDFWVLLKYNVPVKFQAKLEDVEGFEYEISFYYETFTEALKEFVSEEFLQKINSAISEKNIKHPIITNFKFRAQISKNDTEGVFTFNVLPFLSKARIKNIPLLQEKVRSLLKKAEQETPELLF